MSIKSLKFSNYRSAAQEILVPLSSGMTLIVGPNNTGKSSILRFLVIVFNHDFKSIQEDLDYSNPEQRSIKLELLVANEFVRAALAKRPQALSALLRKNSKSDLVLNYSIEKSGKKLISLGNIDDLIPSKYFTDEAFLDDFGHKSSSEFNKQSLLSSLGIEGLFGGTTYLPNVRFISIPQNPPHHFGQPTFPGAVLDPSSIVQQLVELDRPETSERVDARRKMQSVCELIRTCLECGSVKIEVPASRSTILVSIDGNEQPISNLGTGVEQLVMIGLAAFLFPEKLVLIDEPELHFHPRAQKKLMRHLASVPGGRFVVATHSAAVLDSVQADIIRLERSSNGCRVSQIQNRGERYRAIRDLGHTPSELIQANFVIWVEGPSDRIYLKSWISQLDDSLTEGIDYSIVFCGGRVLAHHSFTGESSDLVDAVSVSRQFAVLLDSDQKSDSEELNETKLRVILEIQNLGGYAWVTNGREIENYLPTELVDRLAERFRGGECAC